MDGAFDADRIAAQVDARRAHAAPRADSAVRERDRGRGPHLVAPIETLPARLTAIAMRAETTGRAVRAPTAHAESGPRNG